MSCHIKQCVYLTLELGQPLATRWVAGWVLDEEAGRYVVAVPVFEGGPKVLPKASLKVGGKDFVLVGGRSAQLAKELPAGAELAPGFLATGFPTAPPSASDLVKAYHKADAGVTEEDKFLPASDIDSGEEIRALRAEVARLRAELQAPAASVSSAAKGKTTSFSLLTEEEVEEEEEAALGPNLDRMVDEALSVWGHSDGAPRTSAASSSVPSLLPQNAAKARRPQAAPAAPPPPTVTTARNGLPLDLTQLVILEIYKRLRPDDDESPFASLSTDTAKGVDKALRQHRLLKQKIESEPDRLTTEFLEDVKEELGVIEGQAFNLRDFGRRIPWKRLRSLHKVFVLLVAVFEHVDAGRQRVARALLVQGMKALHQVALDNGSWTHGWALTGLVYPDRPRQFGGSERELEVISAYQRALDDLAKRTKADGKGGDDEQKK